MLELKKSRGVNNSEKLIIKTNEGPFKIYYDTDMNLYWSCSTFNSDEKEESHIYVIDFDNKYIYRIFSELYDSIISKRPFKHFKTDDPEKYYSYSDNDLVKGEVVEWHSDGYDNANVLRIEKDMETEYFIVSFHIFKSTIEDFAHFCTYSVKIDTCESRYDPYNAVFIDMYRKLDEYCQKRGHTFSKKNTSNKKKLRIR